MDKTRSIVVSVAEDIFEDLAKVAAECEVSVEEVAAQALVYTVKQMGTDFLSEGIRSDWDFDEDEPDADDRGPIYPRYDWEEY